MECMINGWNDEYYLLLFHFKFPQQACITSFKKKTKKSNYKKVYMKYSKIKEHQVWKYN